MIDLTDEPFNVLSLFLASALTTQTGAHDRRNAPSMMIAEKCWRYSTKTTNPIVHLLLLVLFMNVCECTHVQSSCVGYEGIMEQKIC